MRSYGSASATAAMDSSKYEVAAAMDRIETAASQQRWTQSK
jgi:hypothetical protein